ncbi:MAG: class I SAM-dependent methyltransferase [Chitinophagaceae bacterium]|nr:class I SAM-dependent methyltransferase [Chitinophagaceae bacterium]
MDNRTFDDFDAYAKNYRAIHTKNIQLSGADSYYFAEMRVQMLQGYEQNESLKVLDLGCGDGVSEIFMQQYFPQWTIEGIDVSKESIEMAKQQQLANSNFAVYDGIHIPFEDNSFNIVFVAGVLHHVEFNLHSPMLDEMKRVLKPGGRLIIYEHNPLNPLTKYIVNTCAFDQDARLLRCGYLSRLLLRHQFNINQRLYFIFFPPKGIFKKMIGLEKYLHWLPLGGKYFIRAVK